MKCLLLFMGLVMIFSSLLSQIAIMPEVGDGSEENPFEISSLENLYWITASNDVVEDPDREIRWSSHYTQINDIDAIDTETWFEGEGWSPIGIFVEPDHNDNLSFTGLYDGQHYIIEGLNINRPAQNYIGMFGICDEATIENVGLIDIDVTGGMYVGGLIGLAMDADIVNCFTTGTVTGTDERVGGIIGNNISSFVNHCYSSAAVAGENQLVGGLIGVDFYSMIKKSYSTGEVNTQADYVGGLIGAVNDSYVNECFSTGNVTGNIRVGGLLGINREYSNVSNSYSRGNVIGDARVGGFAGVVINNGMIQHCYSTGSVTGNNNVGGLVGRQVTGPTAVNSYWDTESSGQTSSASGEGRTTSEMTHPHDENTYVSWDFMNNWAEDENYSINNGYPYLQWEFTLDPNPCTAVDPIPEDNATDVPITLSELSWSYFSHPDYSDPVGFRIYMNKTGEFSEDDDYAWVAFSEEQVQYSSSLVLDELGYDTTYFWQVVPTTIPGREFILSSRIDTSNELRRGDALNCPIWSFTVEVDTSAQNFADEIGSKYIMNYPNPFNPETVICFSLPENTEVDIEIYNVRGQKIKTLINKPIEAGCYEITWDGKNQSGKPVGSGFYFAVLTTREFTIIERMLLLR